MIPIDSFPDLFPSDVSPNKFLQPSELSPDQPLQVYSHQPKVTVPPVQSPVDPISRTTSDIINSRWYPLRTSKPVQWYGFIANKFSSAYLSFLASVHSHVELQTCKEASSVPQWQQAMTEESVALHKTHTWDFVRLRLGKSTIGCKWVFKIKTKADGSIDRYKVRLVAKGYT